MKPAVPDLIISRAAIWAESRIFSGVSVLSKGSMIRVQIMGFASSTRPFNSCWPVCMWLSMRPGMNSLFFPSMVSPAS